MQKILKNKKGSISLFVLLSSLFFLVVVTSVGISFKNKEASIDSQFEKIKSSYEKDVGNEEQIYNEESKKHIVSFDANGGTVSIESKMVIEGDEYGELPTPTRDGYTFKGWNGKNMFDEESLLMAISGATYSNNHYSFEFVNAYKKYGKNGNSLPITDFKQNTQYTYSVYGYVSGSNSLRINICFFI